MPIDTTKAIKTFQDEYHTLTGAVAACAVPVVGGRRSPALSVGDFRNDVDRRREVVWNGDANRCSGVASRFTENVHHEIGCPIHSGGLLPIFWRRIDQPVNGDNLGDLVE